MQNLPHAAARIIANGDLAEIMPHKGKMLLISRVVEYDINIRFLRSEYDIDKSCLFYDSAMNGVPSYMCFEFMAQAVSALSGITGKILNLPPKMGFILSVSALEIKLPIFKQGDILSTEVNGQQAVDAVSTFDCITKVGDNIAVSAKLMVMDIDDPLKFFGKENK